MTLVSRKKFQICHEDWFYLWIHKIYKQLNRLILSMKNKHLSSSNNILVIEKLLTSLVFTIIVRDTADCQWLHGMNLKFQKSGDLPDIIQWASELGSRFFAPNLDSHHHIQARVLLTSSRFWRKYIWAPLKGISFLEAKEDKF